jgi:hypothetical protein
MISVKIDTLEFPFAAIEEDDCSGDVAASRL